MSLASPEVVQQWGHQRFIHQMKETLIMAKTQATQASAAASTPTPTVDSLITELRLVTSARLAQIQAEAEDWCANGEWGDNGASLNVYWTLQDEDGDEIETGRVTVDCLEAAY